MSLISHIEYLLTEHDCVIVPGIGAILAHSVPAYFDAEEWIWHPPSRVFSFNPELTRTDGLIASSVARRDDISVNSAASIVRTECDKMHRSLLKNRTLAFGEVGELYMNDEGRMSFVPGSVAWLSPSTMWLPELKINEEKDVDNPAISRFAREAVRRKRNERMGRIASIAASILVIFAIGWIAFNNLSDLPSINFASLFPVQETTQTNEGFFADSISFEPAKVILAQEPQKTAVDENIACKLNPDARFLLIVGSFSSEQEALSFINGHSNIPLGLICSDGKYRVFAASDSSWDKVVAAADTDNISYNFTSWWILAR